MMNTWDGIVFNQQDQPVLLIEVKSKRNATSEWVTQLRRNILSHGSYPDTPFFLIALVDYFYLWTPQHTSSERSPDYIIDARNIIQTYLGETTQAKQSISESSLELIVAAWLREAMYSDGLPNDTVDTQSWLFESGLYEAMVGGRFEYEALA